MSATMLEAPTLAEIEEARERIRGIALRTPLVKLNADGPLDIWLKLECLQPIGSFKLRGAGSAMTAVPRERLAAGVYTASAGNMAQGVAWVARELGVPCRVIVPDTAPENKLAAIARLGATTVTMPFDAWWQVIIDHGHPGEAGFFVHPVSDPAVMAGNATIALEILEDLPHVDAVIVPYGGGGLSCGIAAALRAKRPGVPVYASEVSTAAPLGPSLREQTPQTTTYTPSFIDGIGSRALLREMWPIARELLAGSIVVSVSETARALQLVAERNHVIAEGAGATSVAAALSGGAGRGTIVCVVSGGNIDAGKLATILRGETPS